MSTFVSASRENIAQAKETQGIWAIGLLIAACLFQLMLAFANESFAQALQLTGQLF
jgi:hypothetical protein